MTEYDAGDTSTTFESVGFIGLGVMGEPMCRNLVQKASRLKKPVQLYDLQQDPLNRLEADGGSRCNSIAELASSVDVLFLSLPGGPEVEFVVSGPEGILANARSGLTIVDHSTSPVGLTRDLAKCCAAQQIGFADAPVARTRAAAIEGTLAIMVGADDAVFNRIKPLLDCMASDVLHCGEVGAGQIVKILNNMVLFQTVAGLAEALTLARRSGLDGDVLFSALKQGSADSFALRNHGEKALLTGVFPTQAFSTKYASKDLEYALQLASETGTDTPGANSVKALFEKTIAAGHGDEYWPALLHTIDSQ